MLDFGKAYNVTPKEMNTAKNIAIEAIKKCGCMVVKTS